MILLSASTAMLLIPPAVRNGIRRTATSRVRCCAVAARPSYQSILLVGEGDFSYAADACARSGNDRLHLLATTLDSPSYLSQHYPSSPSMIQRVQQTGSGVAYGVDATDLCSSARVKECGPYDIVRFNFPHIPSATPASLGNSM